VATGNNLTDNNTVASAAGIISNGASYIAANSEALSIVDNPSLTFTTALSISFWIKQATLAKDRAFIGKWTYQTDGGFVIQSCDSSDAAGTAGDMSIFIATSAADSGAGCRMDFNDADMTAGSFFHVVMVYDGSLSGNANRLKLWINNVAKTLTVGAGAVPASLLADTAVFYLGEWGGTLPRYFDGILDEVGLWSRAITGAEVTTLYNGGAGLTYPFGSSANKRSKLSISNRIGI